MRRWRFWGFSGSCIPCQCTPKFSICSSSIDDLSTAAPSTRFPRSRAVYSPCIGTYVGAKFDFCQWVRVFIQNATKTRKCNKKTPLLKHFSETLECCLKRTSMKNNIKRLVVAVFFKEDHCFAVGVSSCQFCNWVVFPPLLSPNVNLPTCPLFHLTYFFFFFFTLLFFSLNPCFSLFSLYFFLTALLFLVLVVVI